jgi:hypothetical protein
MPLKTLKIKAFDVKTYPRVQPKLPEGLGAVTLNLQHGGLESPMKFYMIDAEPSYRALLGRPWLHNNQFFLSKESKEKDKFSESVKTSRNVMQTKNQNMMHFKGRRRNQVSLQTSYHVSNQKIKQWIR